MDTLITINRGMTKLCMLVYLVLSVRQAMETVVNSTEKTKNQTTRACIPRFKRQTSNRRRIFKRKQAKNKPTHTFIPRSKHQTSSQTSNVDACKLRGKNKAIHPYILLVLSVRRAMETLINESRREKKLHVHVYLVLSIRRAMETLVNSSRQKLNYTCMYTSF